MPDAGMPRGCRRGPPSGHAAARTVPQRGEVVLDLGSGRQPRRTRRRAPRRAGRARNRTGHDPGHARPRPPSRRRARRHQRRVPPGPDRGHPLPDSSADVVVSNCVITLSADKPGVFAEVARVLRPGGRISISDILAEFTLTDAERAANADRIECLTGSLTIDQYAASLATAGLTDATIRRGDAMDGKLLAATITAVRGTSTVHIEPMTAEHANQVLAVYRAGFGHGQRQLRDRGTTMGALGRRAPPETRLRRPQRGWHRGRLGRGRAGIEPVRLRRSARTQHLRPSRSPRSRRRPRAAGYLHRSDRGRRSVDVAVGHLPETSAASRCTSAPDSGWSADASASDSVTETRATSF